MAGGKAPSSSKAKRQQNRHQPLQAQIEEDSRSSRPLKGRAQKGTHASEDAEDVDTQMSAKILGTARAQVAEDQEERPATKKTEKKKQVQRQESESEEEDFSEDEEAYDREMHNIELSEEDAQAFEKFLPKEGAKRQNLSDIIMAKISEAKGEITREQATDHVNSQFSPKVVQVYAGVGRLLSNYTHGRIPKAFKMIPSLTQWEEVVYLTDPEHWSPVAMFQATRLFTSIMSQEMSQRFYNLILLPAVLADIEKRGKLNFHYYQALKKALFKPGAFFKGIMLPLIESGECGLREANIVCSVLSKVSVPVLHSSAALLKLAEMDYDPAHTMFLGTLLQKKYALPYRVVDEVVNHFLARMNDEQLMPVLWHRALLTFVQRYRSDLQPQQKEQLYKLVKKQPHAFFTAEVRRELANSVNRGQNSTQMDLA